jgi:alcohol dehydrogenase class IV
VPGLRDHELALIGVSLRVASPAEDDATGAATTITALRTFLASVDQRQSLRSLGFDAASLDVLAADAIADAAIRNAPRLPTQEEARMILDSVLD